MHQAIRESSEAARGCGYRKEKGLYLISGNSSVPCGKLPIEVGKCPTCGGGVKPARGWTWVDADELLKGALCEFAMAGAPEHCTGCPLAEKMGRCGLIWIGEKFYPTPESWSKESQEMGVSRRIPAVPRGLDAKNPPYVLVAHRKGIERPCPECYGSGGDCPTCAGEGVIYRPAIFSGFQPTAIEIIVSGEEPDEKIEALLERGLSPVKVTKLGQNAEMEFDRSTETVIGDVVVTSDWPFHMGDEVKAVGDHPCAGRTGKIHGEQPVDDVDGYDVELEDGSLFWAPVTKLQLIKDPSGA
jgi:hypothetical protein